MPTDNWANTRKALGALEALLACPFCHPHATAIHCHKCMCCTVCLQQKNTHLNAIQTVCAKSSRKPPRNGCLQQMVAGVLTECAKIRTTIDGASVPTNDSRLQSNFVFRLSKPKEEKRNSKGETQLHELCRKYHTQMALDVLLRDRDHKVNVNTRDHSGWTPLHETCSSYAHTSADRDAMLELSRRLIASGALVNVAGGHELRSPLHEAVLAKDLQHVKLLLASGANHLARDLWGQTPLGVAQSQPDCDDILDAIRRHAGTQMQQKLEQLDSSLSQRLQLQAGLSLATTNHTSVCLCSTNASDHQRSLVKRVCAKFDWRPVSARSGCYDNYSVLVTTACADTDENMADRMRVLASMAHGLFVVSIRWFDELDGIADTCTDPCTYMEPAAISAVLREQLMQPPLLAGLHIYLQGTFISPSRPELEHVLRLSGARLLKRAPNPEAIPAEQRTVPYHAAADSRLANCSHLVCYTTQPAICYDMAHFKCVPLHWLLLVLETYTLLDP